MGQVALVGFDLTSGTLSKLNQKIFAALTVGDGLDGSNQYQLTSPVTTGTAPFVINSSTMVSNLNADLLDGIQESAMLRTNQARTLSTDITADASGGIDMYVAGISDGLKVPGNNGVPSGTPETGALCIDYANNDLYYANSANAWVKVGQATASGVSSVTATEAINASPTTGNVILSWDETYTHTGAKAETGAWTFNGAHTVDTTGAIVLEGDLASRFNVTGNNVTLSTTTSGDVIVTSANTLDSNCVAYDLDATGALTIDAVAASYDSTDNTNLTMTANFAGSKTLTIEATNASGGGTGNLDINADDAITVDSSAAGISLDGVTDSNYTVTGSGQSLTLSVAGGGAQKLNLLSAGTGADAVRINASGASGGIDMDSLTGGVTIDSTGTFSGDFVGASNLTTTGAAFTISGAGLNLAAGSAEMDLTTTGTLDMNCATGTLDATNGFTITGSGAPNTITSTSQNLTLSTTTTGTVAVTSATDVDINATTGATLDATTVSIDGTDNSNVTVTGSAKTLTLSAAGGSTNQVIVQSAGTGADAVRINATGVSGGLDIDTLTGGITGDTTGVISWDATGAVNLTSSGAAATLSGVGANIAAGNAEVDVTTTGALDMNFGAATLDGTGTIQVNSTGGAISIGDGANNYAINVGTQGNRTLTIGNNNATTAVDLKAGTTGGFNFNDGAATIEMINGAITETSLASINLVTSGAITLQGAGITTLGDTTGYTVFNAGAFSTTGITTADWQTSGNFKVDSSGGTLGFGTDDDDFNINIGTNGERDIYIGNATGTTSVTITSATGEVTTLTNDVVVTGDLTVQGTFTTIETSTVLNADPYSHNADGYTSTSAQTGGLTVTYQATTTTANVSTGGYNAGVLSTSNPYVYVSTTTGFATGQIIMSHGAATAANNGYYEVLSVTAGSPGYVTVRGVGVTAPVEAWSSNQFVTDSTAQGTITHVNLSIIRTQTDGDWAQAKGNTTPFTFYKFTTGSGSLSLQNAYLGGNTIITASSTPVDITLTSGGMNITTSTSGNLQVDDGTNDFLLTDDTNSLLKLGSSSGNGVAFYGTVTAPGNPTWNFGTNTLTGSALDLTTDLSVDTIGAYSGSTVTVAGCAITGGVAAASAKVQTSFTTGENLAVGNLCQVNTSGQLVKSNATALPKNCQYVSMEAKTSGQTCKATSGCRVNVLLVASLTVNEGDEIFVSKTAGSGTNNVAGYAAGNWIQLVGVITNVLTYNGTSDLTVEIEFNPGDPYEII